MIGWNAELRGRRLWLAVVLGPLAWLLYLQAAYGLVPLACTPPTGRMLALQLAAAVALGLGSAGVLTAWRAWHRVGREPARAALTATARTRIMVLAGIGASALFVLVVVAGVLPLLFLAPCE